jgi:hypothetical protein
LPSIGWNAGTAVLHLAVDADDCTLSMGDGRPVEQLHEFRHEPLAEHRSRFEQRSEIIDDASGEWIGDYGHPDRTHYWTRRCNSKLREDCLAHTDLTAWQSPPDGLEERKLTSSLPRLSRRMGRTGNGIKPACERGPRG